MLILSHRSLVSSAWFHSSGRRRPFFASSLRFQAPQSIQQVHSSSGGLKLRAARGNAPRSGAKKKSQVLLQRGNSGSKTSKEESINKARIILERRKQQQESGDLNAATEQFKEVAVPLLDADDSLAAPQTRQEDEQLFESRLLAVQRSVSELRQDQEEKQFRPIDYDRPVVASENNPSTNFFWKVGVGLAVVVFGVVFAVGDFLPSVRPPTQEESKPSKPQLGKEESVRLEAKLQELEATLKESPEDSSTRQKLARVYMELGDYKKAVPVLEKLSESEPNNVEVWQLLGESQNAIGEYRLSADAYSAGIKVADVSRPRSFALLQGLTDALISDGKPSEAVSQLLNAKAECESGFSGGEGGLAEQADVVDIELLLAKAYVAWGHTGDAITVYEQLIASHPEDFRGYLAKAILLKEKGKSGDAERMFIQARYLAPAEAKRVVDRFAGRES